MFGGGGGGGWWRRLPAAQKQKQKGGGPMNESISGTAVGGCVVCVYTHTLLAAAVAAAFHLLSSSCSFAEDRGDPPKCPLQNVGGLYYVLVLTERERGIFYTC